jgi:flagellar basal-body rod protein FlgG
MIRSIYTAVSGMVTEEAKQNTITNNLANANTNGFKSDNQVIKEFKDVLIMNHQNVSNGVNMPNVLGTLSLGSQVDETDTNFVQGSLTNTNVKTDFAINGNGFFTVSSGNGNTSQNYYTRNGHFMVDSQGYLVDGNGNYVMGKNLTTGTDGRIQVGNSNITSDTKGNLSLDGKPSYSLDLVDFSNYKSLTKVGDNLYQGANPITNANVNVVQGSLEGSNVNVVNQMIDMMSTMRNFESDQKVVQSIDETLGQTVNDVGTVK